MNIIIFTCSAFLTFTQPTLLPKEKYEFPSNHFFFEVALTQSAQEEELSGSTPSVIVKSKTNLTNITIGKNLLSKNIEKNFFHDINSLYKSNEQFSNNASPWILIPWNSNTQVDHPLSAFVISKSFASFEFTCENEYYFASTRFQLNQQLPASLFSFFDLATSIKCSK